MTVPSPDAGASAPAPDWRSLLEQVRHSDPAKDALGAYIAALEAETLSARRELFAWKAQFAHRQRMKAGVRSAVTWLHRRADSMNDPIARQNLHSAATNLGWELARVGPEGLEDAAPRPVTGFFSSLTPEQKETALAYRGPENIGEGEFRLDAEDEPPQALVDIMILHNEVAADAKAALDTARPVDLPPWLVEMPNAGLMVRGDDAMTAALAYVERVGAEAVEDARIEPLVPLAGTEPWEEPLRVFGRRVQRAFPHVDLGGWSEERLETFAASEGILRARLALAGC